MLERVDAGIVIVFALSGAASIACWVVLWRGLGHIATKVLWTFIAAAPVVGPLFFAAFHDPPPAQPEVDRASETSWDMPGHNHPPDFHA
jgi:hypothetical protein